MAGTTEDAGATDTHTRSVVTALSVKLHFLIAHEYREPGGFCPLPPSEVEGSLLRLLNILKSTAACLLVPTTADVSSPLYPTASIGTAPMWSHGRYQFLANDLHERLRVTCRRGNPDRGWLS